MRESIGGSMLLYIVVIFTGLVITFFVSILSYSKAYRIKNRIVEVIEKYGSYELEASDESGMLTNPVTDEINSDLNAFGYDTSISNKCDNIRNKLVNKKYLEEKVSLNKNSYGYNYCVFEITGNSQNSTGKYYVVVTFTQFDIPIVGDALMFPVYGETKMLGKTYDYD